MLIEEFTPRIDDGDLLLAVVGRVRVKKSSSDSLRSAMAFS